MPERVFLCGLSAEQRAAYPTGTILSLDKSSGNLVLKLGRMRRKLVGTEPKPLTDLIEIASYVFAADRTTGRGDLDDRGYGPDWRRSFFLVIAVRDLALWQRQDVNETLCEALNFLSEDEWRFEFADNQNPISIQDYLGLKEQDADASGGTSVVLFSGGLDSLAGAVHELRHTNRHVVLVSHRNLPGIGSRQRRLAEQLEFAYPRRVTHIWVDNNLSSDFGRLEESQRTRSFFFTAMATVAAHIEGADRIRFYENGVMSVNLPIATQVVGARASRSTHPRSLQLLKDVVELVSMYSIEVDNPFIWKTKAEVVGELAITPQAGLIVITVSCTRARTANRIFQPHCGTCIQCLQRRMATLAAGVGALDERDCYEVDFLEGPRKDGLDRVMALEALALALDCADISATQFIDRFADPVAWVFQAYKASEQEEVAHKLVDLFQRHGGTVRAFLATVMGARALDVLDKTLHPSSLLALTLASRLNASVYRPAEQTPARLPEPKIEPISAVTSDRIFVAVDEVRHRIRIWDQADLRGHTIFPIMRMLMAAAQKDRVDGLLPKNHRAFSAEVIADSQSLSNADAVRSAIRRIRNELEDAEAALYSVAADQNALIETTSKGYRLNPAVVVVTLDEFNKL